MLLLLEKGGGSDTDSEWTAVKLWNSSQPSWLF